MIIAIDGPAATGKSTTAKLVAVRLGFTYLDTGAMYRAVTLAVNRCSYSLNDTANIKALLDKMELDLEKQNGELIVLLSGEDVTDAIRSSDVTDNVSAVSALPAVREAMVVIQRRLGSNRNCVVEGRDIGTVVFPEAEYKFFIVADYKTRAMRRQKDLEKLNENRSVEMLIKDLKARDQKDSSRMHSPLKRAEDAMEVDTSNLTIDQQVDLIVNEVEKSINKLGK